MPEHAYVKEFAGRVTEYCDYQLTQENPMSRVVLLERVA